MKRKINSSLSRCPALKSKEFFENASESNLRKTIKEEVPGMKIPKMETESIRIQSIVNTEIFKEAVRKIVREEFKKY